MAGAMWTGCRKRTSQRDADAVRSLVSHDEPIDDQVLQILGKGDFLNRVYESQNGDRRVPPVGLFIGYFPTQRTGQTIHSPQHCLPGAGWTFESSRYTNDASC